jgi:hypothetical protein
VGLAVGENRGKFSGLRGGVFHVASKDSFSSLRQGGFSSLFLIFCELFRQRGLSEHFPLYGGAHFLCEGVAGARSAGARSAGARSAGARSAGARSAGARSAGARSAGAQKKKKTPTF